MIDKILKTIEQELRKNNEIYFGYAWREKIENWLVEESKYCRLFDWINDEIKQKKSLINIFSPASKEEEYTQGLFDTYMDQLRDFAFLLDMKGKLMDKRCTEKERENIEYTICKIYKIKYNDYLKFYI